MCDGSIPRIAFYTFLVAGSLAPLSAMIGGKLWPEHTTRVALASLGFFLLAGIAGAIYISC